MNTSASASERICVCICASACACLSMFQMFTSVAILCLAQVLIYVGPTSMSEVVCSVCIRFNKCLRWC